jgi:hypothetical protein
MRGSDTNSEKKSRRSEDLEAPRFHPRQHCQHVDLKAYRLVLKLSVLDEFAAKARRAPRATRQYAVRLGLFEHL